MAGPVERAVRRDLRRLDKQARESGLAAAALELARLLDLPLVPGNRYGAETTDKRIAAVSQATRELRATMTQLLADAPREEKDAIDDLRARRDTRDRAAG